MIPHRLIEQITTEMSTQAALQGVDIDPARLYGPVKAYLTEAETVWQRPAIEAVPVRDWATLLSHAHQSALSITQILLQMTCNETGKAAQVIAQMKHQQRQSRSRQSGKPQLRLVKR